ncbi:MAG TPA: serine hydrolase domain-containing protein [Cyclobacteriaceae bacterium]|nr:serine hydrolase domain-containing protein [Cyclobacteriaceae bacterium]
MRHLLFALLICIGCGTAFAQTNDTTARIDKLFSSWNNATPGGSILVARGTNIIYHKAYGMADLERDVPNTNETIFEAGSVSKQFTAFSILLLESEGKLSRTDDVRKYVPELPVYQAPITIQHLLNHTSGLRDWGSVVSITGWDRQKRGHTLAMALQVICRQQALNFKPGDEYSYSNSNYTILTAVVERISKQALEDFTKEKLFKPLGMTNTRWRSNYRKVIPRRAQAYGQFDNETLIIMPIEDIYGHAGLLTTTGDLLKWNQLLETYQVGGEDIFKRRIETNKLNNGSVNDYGAGITNSVANSGFRVYSHSGATAGYRAMLMYYPQKKLSIAILSNDGGFAPAKAGYEISDIFLGHGPEQPSSPEESDTKTNISYNAKELNAFTGEFYSADAGGTWKLRMKDNGLEAINEPLVTFPMTPTDQRDVFTADGLRIEFKKNKKGAITGFTATESRARNVPFTKTSK